MQSAHGSRAVGAPKFIFYHYITRPAAGRAIKGKYSGILPLQPYAATNTDTTCRHNGRPQHIHYY